MSFYSSISKYYDFIFPYDAAQLEFLSGYLLNHSSRILDIGCSTGSLSIELAKAGCSVYSIDNDPEMINTAAIKKKNFLQNSEFPVFEQMDMLDVTKKFQSDFFQLVFCFGNTLVHLPNNKKISYFLNSINIILNKDGYFLIQVLNYDNILENKISELPVIENQHVRFERSYEYSGRDKIDFITKCFIKNEEKTIKNRIKLFPVTKNVLNDLLNESGFRNIKFYSDFKKSAFNEDALPLVIECTKKSVK